MLIGISQQETDISVLLFVVIVDSKVWILEIDCCSIIHSGFNSEEYY